MTRTRREDSGWGERDRRRDRQRVKSTNRFRYMIEYKSQVIKFDITNMQKKNSPVMKNII